MVEIEEIIEDDPQQQPAAATSTTNNAADSRSQERLSDADEIESAVLANITRPSARLHVQNLITKLRKEGKALQRVAASKAASSSSSDADSSDMKPSSVAQASSSVKDPPPVPKRSPAEAIITTNKYQSFPTYYFDAGKYDSATVSVYIPLEGIGQHDKSKISCTFTSSSFDLIVTDWNGKSYRLLNDNLEKDIDMTKSKHVIKPNKIIIKLGKVKGEYGFDSWQQLTAKKTKKRGAGGKSAKEDPSAGIMDMMKDMYDGGDDTMKKMIGETMYKQRTGQLGKDGGMGGMDDMMGGMGGMGM
mmetsp:Transcript_6603/g.11488  ORF Transcript_6603/g.11488 Transcript_6603/m.11488 type:complete len:302 (-) Transcript_6603:223-1128(-)|eukprot:CAMPEP_0201883400 /NCGR_PEP_ID=MMETSP0902-20130614/15562_1 /ASSEMBLY_ACC=CAM_ASM_000551 /TAXON_ID=420261 /ORGANISM="Thalassiosira antarctica, Strain CCMP982" /LENGTH=301 /DNA_ID=CAMNT_0048412177 /DNA_START=75 /DNA_END=980 /DNA_ORIENTATION=+